MSACPAVPETCGDCGARVTRADLIEVPVASAVFRRPHRLPVALDPEVLPEPADDLVLHLVGATLPRPVVIALGTREATVVAQHATRAHCHRLHVCPEVPSGWALPAQIEAIA